MQLLNKLIILTVIDVNEQKEKCVSPASEGLLLELAYLLGGPVGERLGARRARQARGLQQVQQRARLQQRQHAQAEHRAQVARQPRHHRHVPVRALRLRCHQRHEAHDRAHVRLHQRHVRLHLTEYVRAIISLFWGNLFLLSSLL